MSPQEFKTRFIASLPKDPPNIELHLDEFVPFPASLIESLVGLTQSDKAILSISGLPKSAAPFLSFGLSADCVLQPLSTQNDMPDSFGRYRMIGHNGSGDMICIDEADHGAVVYLNHDRNMEVIFMNSDITALAESLCIFGELMKDRNAEAARHKLRSVDPTASITGNCWPSEIDAFEHDW